MKSKEQTVGDIWTHVRAVGDNNTFSRSVLNDAVRTMKGNHNITADRMIAAAKDKGSITYDKSARIWIIAADGPILRHIKGTSMQSSISPEVLVLTDNEIIQIYQEYISLGGYTADDAVDAVVHTTGMPRKTIVDAVLKTGE